MEAAPSKEALERYQEARALMSRHLAFFSTLLMWAQVEWSTEVKIAATDGSTLWLNPEGFGGLSRGEMVGVLCHEVLHMALEHVGRRGRREVKLWNIACDISVNGMIKEEMQHSSYLSLPNGLVVATHLEGHSPEEIYEILRQEGGKAFKQQTSLWDIAEEAKASVDKPAWSQAMQEALARSSGQGLLYERLARAREGMTDWRKALWDFLTPQGGDYGGFDRRFVGAGLYLDGLEGHFIPEALNLHICVDTSASVSDALLGVFLGEIRAIASTFNQVEPVLWSADANLHGPMDLDNFKLLGGGGTDFRPFFEKLKPEHLAVYLTDGFGMFPGKPHPKTLWVVTPRGAANDRFPFGKVVRLVSDVEDEDQFGNTYSQN